MSLIGHEPAGQLRFIRIKLSCYWTRILIQRLEILLTTHTSVLNHIHKIDYVSRLYASVPHALTEAQLARRTEICDSLIRLENKNHSFLKSLVTGDEKWIGYSNLKRKRSWGSPSDPPNVTPKADLDQKKVMLSIWWDWKGILHFEPLPPSRTINSDVYCEQLDKSKKEIEKKIRRELVNRRGVVFHPDNARPHTSLKTQQKLRELDWDILPHLPYSLDLAPSDCHLFRSLEHYLRGKKCESEEHLQTNLLQFFTKKGKFD